jgi:SHS2 domain-containing protein
LKADLSGASLEALAKQIKAVTYHNLHRRRTNRGLETEIVFDV